MSTICERLASVRTRIDEAASTFGRDPSQIRLLAVSKTQPPEVIEKALACGQTCFGESYAQELLEKARRLERAGIEWHFIGPVQANKTRPIAAVATWVHSVDRMRVAERLNVQRPEGLPPLEICLQVNVSGEASKSGVPLDQLPALAEACAGLSRLHLRGLMTIPAPSTDLDEQRRAFARLRKALEDLQGRGLALDTLSMGMTGDLEAAVAEGATIVRIGTAIFGERLAPARGPSASGHESC